MDERKISHERPKGGRRGVVGLFIPLLQIYLFILSKKKNSRLKHCAIKINFVYSIHIVSYIYLHPVI